MDLNALWAGVGGLVVGVAQYMINRRQQARQDYIDPVAAVAEAYKSGVDGFDLLVKSLSNQVGILQLQVKELTEQLHAARDDVVELRTQLNQALNENIRLQSELNALRG